MIEQKKCIIDKNIILTAILLASLPLIMFVLSLIFDGASLSSLRIPSLHNDELVYYYEVEGVLEYGMPQGLFGYNENYANIFSFGAWSPTLILNYCIFGKIFGWSSVNAVVYNVVMMMIAMFIFGIVARPNPTQTGWLVILYLSYTFINESVLSVSPEVTCYFYAIISIGIAYSCFRENKLHKIICIFILGLIQTSMRPYYAPFIIIGGFFLYKLYGKKSLIVSAFMLCFGFYIYAFICENMCVQSPISGKFSKIIKEIHINTDVSVRGGSPLLASGEMYKKIKNLVKGVLEYLKQLGGFFCGNGRGRNFFLFTVLCCLVIVYLFILYSRYKKTKNKDLSDKELWHIFWGLYYIAMFFAICTMFINAAADRHLAEFVLMSIFVLAMEFDRTWQFVMFEVFIAYSLLVAPNGHRQYLSGQEIDKIYAYKAELMETMPLVLSDGPTWDNTVLWIYADYTSGEFRETPWQTMFAFPDGYAFNLCYINGFLSKESIKSKYVVTTPGGDTEKKCYELGCELIGRYGDMVLFRNY